MHPGRVGGSAGIPGSTMALAATPVLGIAAVSVLILGACAANGTESEGESPMPERSIEEVQEAHTPNWMALAGVVGTGIGRCDGEPCILVYASRETDEIREQIPAEVEGYRVRVEVTGPFTPREPDAPPPGS